MGWRYYRRKRLVAIDHYIINARPTEVCLEAHGGSRVSLRIKVNQQYFSAAHRQSGTQVDSDGCFAYSPFLIDDANAPQSQAR